MSTLFGQDGLRGAARRVVERVGEGGREALAWLLAGALLGVAMHWPALSRLGEALPGEPASDVLRAFWSTWLVADSFPGWPFASDAVNFPAGVRLVPFPALTLTLSAPLTWALGAAVSLPLLVVLHVAYGFAASAFLVRTLGGGRGGALVAGALVVTQPLLGGALRDGTLEILAIGWIPMVLAAMIRAVRGSWRWGVAAGLLFLATCLESVYHGSFAALGVLFCLMSLRSRGGALAVAAAGVTVLLGVGVLALAFAPIIDNVNMALATAGEGEEGLRSSNAASIEGLRLLALHPGTRGWRIADLYAPPLAHWVLFGVGGLLALRRAAWLPALGALYVLLAVDDPLSHLWADGPIGQVVRFPRRYMAAAGVALGAAAGVGLRELLRWPKVELGVGAALALFAAGAGWQAGGWSAAYPLITLPEPSFVAPIAADDEDCAALLLPLELPGEAGMMRSEMPVFGGLGSEIASADQLVLQVLMDKAGWYTPSLVTLARRDGATGLLPKNFTDLARASAGGAAPRTSKLAADSYADDLRWLMGEGLKYVLISKENYDEDGLERLDAVFGPVAVEVNDYEDGSGVRVYQLYTERPEAVPVPAESMQGMVASSFRGKVLEAQALKGRVRLVVSYEGQEVTCEVHPERDTFECQGVTGVDSLRLFVDDEPVTATRWSGSLLDATVEYEAPESMMRSQGPTDVVEVEAPPTAPEPFTGVVENHVLVPGAVWVHALAAEGPVRCPVTPETGAFDCGVVSSVRQVRLLADDQEVPAIWDEVVHEGVITFVGEAPSGGPGEAAPDGGVLAPQLAGVVIEASKLDGRLQLEVKGPRGKELCEVHPESGQFRCPEVREVEALTVMLNGVALETRWSGSIAEAEVRYVVDAALLERAAGTSPAGEGGASNPQAFSGTIKNHRRLTGFVEVVVKGAKGSARCPMTPETGAYDCGVVDDITEVLLTSEKRQVASEWDGVVNGGVITYTGSGPGTGGGSGGAVKPDGGGAPPPPSGERGQPFEGVVTNRDGLMGMVEVVVVAGGRSHRCPVTPETGAFSCGFLSDVTAVSVRVEGQDMEADWDGEVQGATVRIER
ncbi:MAG: hypothetical protein H6741_32620 [Alphaproteobacteria bacterium]|nr:hypothetical protein [Alphaproteobacteria bacterium]MCB9797460.1 hypothetical protein [Alphaproteobacteria bacterium]